MDTNINDVQGKFTSDTVKYDDSNLETIISSLDSAVELLSGDGKGGGTIDSNLESLSQNEVEWKGAAKDQYLALKDDFIAPYCRDFATAIKDYRDAVKGLETLLGSIKDSTKIKEIDNA